MKNLVIDGKDFEITKNYIIEHCERNHRGEEVSVSGIVNEIAEKLNMAIYDVTFKKANRSTSVINEFVDSSMRSIACWSKGEKFPGASFIVPKTLKAKNSEMIFNGSIKVSALKAILKDMKDDAIVNGKMLA